MVLEKEAAFFLVHVEPEMAELAVLQRADQRIAFDKAATPGIDQHRAPLHLRECGPVDQMVGAGHQRTMQADDVAFRQQRVERHVARAEREQVVGRRAGIVGEHLHAETRHDAAEYAADHAGADHAHRLAVQVEAEQPMQREIAFTCACDRARQAPVQRQNQTDGMFGNRVRRVGRHPCNRHAETFGCGQVDVIEAR